MEQEYNHLIEVYGQTEMKLIFGSLKGYTTARQNSTYFELTSELDNLMDSVRDVLKLMIK